MKQIPFLEFRSIGFSREGERDRAQSVRGSHTPRLNSATIWTLLPRCSMPWRKDGRCELWDPETSLVMEASEGEMGERRGRLRCQLLAAPLCRCCCCWTPARVRRASSPEMSTRLSLQTACPPFFASSESESETLGEPSLASGDGSRRRLSFASASHAGVIYMCVVMLLR